MVEPAESLSSAAAAAVLSLKDNNKPVIVRVKRKSYHSPLEAFWLEINERPAKRPLLDFANLSISNNNNNSSSSQVEELKSKKFFVQHVETVSNSDFAVDILQSLVASKPNSIHAPDSKAKVEDQRRSNKTDNKQKQLLVKAKETQELLARNARFKQIWKSRKEKDTAASDIALHDMCHLYDVERVDVGETSKVHEEEDEEDRRLMCSFLPLLQEFIPSAAEEIESDIDYQVVKKASKDEYVYDLYAVKDNISVMEEDDVSPFPFVQVDEHDDFYDGPDNSDYETDDSNAEDNPLNDYPDEEDEEEEDEDEEDGDESSDENSEEGDSEFSESEIKRDEGFSDDDMLIYHDEDDDEAYL